MHRLSLPLIFLLALTASLRAADLNVFAAASLSDALTEIARNYEPASGDKLRFNFSASSTLARQIKEGAPADLFFSADEAKMDDLARDSALFPETRRTLLSNSLVIVVPLDSKRVLNSAADLASPVFTRLALAEPQTVPAGIYAKSYLEKIGLWKNVIARVIPTENVRAALAAVETGNVDAAIVYKTDALASKKVRIAFEILPSAPNAPRIAYPLAVVAHARQPEAARAFAAFLADEKAQAIFRRHGFLPAP